MSETAKRTILLGLLAVAVLAVYLAVRRGTRAEGPSATRAKPARAEQPDSTESTARPLDRDFKAAMERDSEAAAHAPGDAH